MQFRVASINNLQLAEPHCIFPQGLNFLDA